MEGNKSQAGWSVRSLSEDDLARIVEIEAQGNPAPWTAGQFMAELAKPHGRVWVYTDDETDAEIAGFVVFWDFGGQIEILNLAVAIPLRGRGFGKALIREVVKEGLRTGAKRVVLDVRKSNLAAIQLYQSMRFTVQHVRKGFYSTGPDGPGRPGCEDAYEMVLKLDGDGPDPFMGF